MRHYIAFLILAFFLTNHSLSAQSINGLYFKSKEVPREERTGLDITPEEPISLEKGLRIQFDIAFRNYIEGFGYIFRIKNEEGDHQLDLICNIDSEKKDLIIVHNHQRTKLEVELTPKGNEVVNHWRSLDLYIDPEKDSITLSFENQKVTDHLALSKEDKISLIFGVVNHYKWSHWEVPPISIRQLTLSDSKEELYHWSFEKKQKAIVKDEHHGREAEIINPDWKINHHFHWEKKKSFVLPKLPQVVFDPEKHGFYFFFKDDYYYWYDLVADELSHRHYKSGHPVLEGAQQVILNKKNQITSYSHEANNLSVFNPHSERWSLPNPIKTKLPKFWHHNKLLHPLTNQITTICGYGFYKYHNDIQYLDARNKKWRKISFEGDTIYPRYLAGLGKSKKDPNSVFLFGGIGNQSGDQVEGTDFFYDLYTINFKTNHIQKIWELENPYPFNFTPVNSMILDEENDHFYTLVFPHQKADTYLKVMRGSLSNPTVSLIGDSIPYHFKDIESFGDLYFWPSQNKLLALSSFPKNSELYEVHLYTLEFPPVDKADLAAFTNQNHPNYWLWVVIILSLILLKVLAGLISKRKKKAPLLEISKPKEVEQKEERSKTEPEQHKGPAILLFGDFQVWDDSGKDISYRFSRTLKKLFMIILLESEDNPKGISSKRIQDILWPEKTESQARNNRNVNIKKLRDLLKDSHYVTLSLEGNFWKIYLEEGIFCDYITVMEILRRQLKTKHYNHRELLPYLKYLAKGPILRNMENEYLDAPKAKSSDLVIKLLETYCSVQDPTINASYLSEIADILFHFDPLNEIALKTKCKGLILEEKKSLAKESYDHFKLKYFKYFNEEFPKTFKEIIK